MTASLAKHFLIATQSLQEDEYFARSVVYIHRHDTTGAAGFIINRPLEVNFTAVLEHLNIKQQRDDLDSSLIYLGGPVEQDIGSFLYTTDSVVNQNSDIYFDTTRENLEQHLACSAIKNFIFVLGSAQWEPGQLETELAGDGWLAVPYDARIIFDTPVPLRWREAAQLLGVNQLHLSRSGNA